MGSVMLHCNLAIATKIEQDRGEDVYKLLKISRLGARKERPG